MIVSFFSVKGGVGKTATSINLAHCLSEKHKKKILVIDLDPQCGASHSLSSKFEDGYKFNNIDAIKRNLRLQDVIYEYTSKLHLVASCDEVYKIFDDTFMDKLSKFIGKVKADYDFIFFDLSPSIFIGTVAPLEISDRVVIPVDCPGGLGILGLESVLKLVAEVKEKSNTKLDVLGILPNMVCRTKVSQEVLDYLKNNYGESVFSGIRRNTAIAESSCTGFPVLKHKPNSYGAKDYMKLAKEFLKRVKAS